MARRSRRNHSPAFKAKVALLAIRGELTMAELSIDDHEQGVIVRIRESVARGASLRPIAHELNAQDEAPHRGKQWYVSSVAAVLKSRIATEAA